MNVDNQLALFGTLVGDDAADPRYSPTDRLSLINQARRWLCEETRCFQIKDSQDTEDGTASYTLSQDVIGLYAAEVGGRELVVVKPQNWRDQVGPDDTFRGLPIMVKVFNRQLQVFRVPVAVETIRYHGWGFASSLTAGGDDVDFTDRMAEIAVNRAAWRAREIDGRDDGGCKAEAMGGAAVLEKQFRPKGARYVIDRWGV